MTTPKPASAPQADALLPCPFCGSASIDPKGWASQNSAGPACDDCGAAAGCVSTNLADNIAAWNRRAASAQVREVEPLRDSLAKMLRAFVRAGGVMTVARHGVDRDQDEWHRDVQGSLIAIEQYLHPERFDSFPTGKPAAEPAPECIPLNQAELDELCASIEPVPVAQEEIRRYNLRVTPKGNGGEMIPHNEGGWIMYADHARREAELESQLVSARTRIGQLEAACDGRFADYDRELKRANSLEASLAACRALPAYWRELSKEQDDRAASSGLTEAEREWHLGRAQQAEDCADKIEAVLPLAGDVPVTCECGGTSVLRVMDGDNVLRNECGDCGKPRPLAGEVANG